MLDQILLRFNGNIARVETLVRLYERSHGQGRGRRSVGATDILRAAAVLLHATLEDFLRSVARWRLPAGPTSTLERIPLVGQFGRAEKFTLAAVAQHRGKTVDEVIQESVNQFLDRSNYNNTNEIAAFVASLGIDIATVDGHFGTLDSLMNRRHLIVHQADHNPNQGRGRYRANHIAPHDLQAWIAAVRAFISDMETQVRALA